MVSKTAELVDVIDVQDRKVRAAQLEECLRDGLLHRAVAVIVRRPSGGIILQRRSLADSWHPGGWTLSCTGHVRSGESYLAAARRELREELGLRVRLVEFRRITLPRFRGNGLVERERVCVFLATSSARLVPDPDEVEEVSVFTDAQVRSMLAGRRLTPDARIILRDYLKARP